MVYYVQKKIDPRRQEFVLEFLIYATLLTHITHIPQKSGMSAFLK